MEKSAEAQLMKPDKLSYFRVHAANLMGDEEYNALSRDEMGSVFFIMLSSWQNKGTVPAILKKLAVIARCSVPELEALMISWPKLKPVENETGRLAIPYMLADFRQTEAKIEINHEKMANLASKRWKKDGQVIPLPPQCDTHSDALTVSDGNKIRLDPDDKLRKEDTKGIHQVIDQSDESPSVSPFQAHQKSSPCGAKAEPPAVAPKPPTPIAEPPKAPTTVGQPNAKVGVTPGAPAKVGEAPGTEEEEPSDEFFSEPYITSAFHDPFTYVMMLYHHYRKSYKKMPALNPDKHAKQKLKMAVEIFFHKNKVWGLAYFIAAMKRFTSDPRLRSGGKFTPVPFAMFTEDGELLMEMAAKQSKHEKDTSAPVYVEGKVKWTWFNYVGTTLINKENPVNRNGFVWFGETWDTYHDAADEYNKKLKSKAGLPKFVQINQPTPF